MSVDRFRLFQHADSPVVLVLPNAQKTAAELRASAGEGEYALPSQTLGRNTSFDLFDQPLQIGVDATASAKIHADGEKLEGFVTGEAVKPPPGTVWSDLELTARAKLAGTGSTTAGAFTLSAKLAAEAALGYRHLLPVPSSETRLGAFLSLAASSSLPGGIRLDALEPGEVHRYVARLGLSLGLEASAGFSAEVKRDINALADMLGAAFADLEGEVSVSVDASFKASIGLALSGDVAITVGRAGTATPGEERWVRVRIARARERRFSAGATFAVQIHYQAAGAANAILDRVFSLLPMPRAIESFQEINALLASGDWDEVKGKLSRRAQSLITGWLDDTGWREKLADSPEIESLVETSAKLVAAYEDLGGELESLFDRLLGEAELEAGSQLRDALREIVDLDQAKLRQRLTGSDTDLAGALLVLELLTGRSLEEIILSSDSDLGRSVTEAQSLAQRALSFLDRLDHLPTDAMARLDDIAESSGIAAVVSWLSANATSVEKLGEAVDERLGASIERVVEHLTQKIFDDLSEAEKERIERWAKKLDELLSTDELEAKLRAAAAKLDGELGFSLAIELERLTRETALLDLELDPRHKGTLEAVAPHLGTGAIGKIVENLPETDDDELPRYRLRECVFVSRRVRTAAIAVLSSFLGARSTRSRWVTERAVRVTQERGALSRHGRWEGGFVRSIMGREADLFEAGAWVSARTSGAGGDLDDPYATPEVDLRLNLQRDDRKTSNDELRHYQTLLDQLGFQIAGGGSLPSLAPGASLETRFALALRLPDALGPLLDGVGKKKGKAPVAWGNEFLDAARRWWDEPLVTEASRDIEIGGRRARLGKVLAWLVADSEFRKAVLRGSAGLMLAFKDEPAKVTIDGQPVSLTLIDHGHWRMDYFSVREVANRVNKTHRRAFELKGRFAKLDGALAGASPADLDGLVKDAAKSFAAATATSWSNPALPFWFVLSRLSSPGQPPLTASQGFATLRWRTGPDSEWERPLRWMLEGKDLQGVRQRGTFG